MHRRSRTLQRDHKEEEGKKKKKKKIKKPARGVKSRSTQAKQDCMGELEDNLRKANENILSSSLSCIM